MQSQREAGTETHLVAYGVVCGAPPRGGHEHPTRVLARAVRGACARLQLRAQKSAPPPCALQLHGRAPVLGQRQCVR
eukprot:1467744-Pyramimonas_sp.AAC.2